MAIGTGEGEAGARLQGCSLVDEEGLLWLPYDIERSAFRPRGLSVLAGVHRATRARFSLDFGALTRLHIINAMGVSLGDSLIGLGVLHWLRQRHPDLHLHLHRARCGPAHVEELYRMAGRLFGDVSYLPVPLRQLRCDGGEIVDIGDIVHWPEFAHMPMADFFAWALGIEPDAMPASEKANGWVKALRLPRVRTPADGAPFILFCPDASTPVRSVPEDLRAAIVDRVWQAYGLPVLGAAVVDHPSYRCIRGEMRGTANFLAWIRAAAAVVSVDSAALHAAAGFDVPCLAAFTTIDPQLRAAYYPQCRVMDLRAPGLHGLHASDDPSVLACAHARWVSAMARDWSWPLPRTVRAPASSTPATTCAGA